MGICAARLEPAATWFETTDVIENMVTRIERILLIMAVLEVSRRGRLWPEVPCVQPQAVAASLCMQ
jgi:hypothetical protein